MNRQRLVIIIVIAAIFLAISLRSKIPKNFGVKLPTSSSQTSAAEQAGHVPMYSIAAQSLPADAPLELLDQNLLSPACKDQWLEIAKLNISELLSKLKAGQMTLLPECAPPTGHPGFLKMVEQSCQFGAKDKPQAKPQTDADCERSLKLQRAFVIDHLTAKEMDYSRLSMVVLTNKFIARQTTHGPESIPELRRMIAEIKRLEPDNSYVYKLEASIEMLGRDPDIHAGEMAAEQGLKLNPKDIELQATWAYFKSLDRDFDYMTFANQNPDNAYAQYFKASLLWKQNQKAVATAIVQTLVQRYPENRQFPETLARIQQKPTPTTSPFFIRYDIH